MRFFVFVCLVTVSCADKLGYNYKPVAHSNSGLSFTPGYSGSASSLRGVSSGLDSIVSGRRGSQSGGSPGDSARDLGNIESDSTLLSAPVELEKEFYTFSAPEEEFANTNYAEEIANSLKRGIRVIFIKGPENNGIENAALALAKNVAEQRTSIYVLNKEADAESLAAKLKSINKIINNKPEVHFVKYRTSEDAANAQKAIQEQYDALGGTSESHQDAVAAVINFASQPPVATARTAPTQTPNKSYLPPSIFRRV